MATVSPARPNSPVSPSSEVPGLSLVSTMSSLSQALAQHVEDSDEESDSVPKQRTGTFLSSWSVLANTILGVGMLALPWAAAQVGWILAGIFLLVAAFFANFSLHLLACIALELGGEDTTFYSVCQVVAPRMRFLVDIAIVVKCFGVATSYLQVIGQTAIQVFHPAKRDYLVFRFLVISLSVLIVSPVCFRRRIGNTRFTNWLALAGILYVWVLLMVCCVGNLFFKMPLEHQQGMTIVDRTAVAPRNVVEVFTTIPVFIFSFTCHQNLFPIANEIKDPSSRRIGCVAMSAVLTAVALYGACIVFGYSTFGSTIQQNFLLGLPQGTLVSIGGLLMATSNALSFPLQSHPCRRSLIVLLNSCTGKPYEYPQVGERLMRRLLTAVILAGAVCTATVVNDLGIVFEIVGTVGSNTICYIMPALLYIHTFRGKVSASGLTLRLAVLQLCVGLLVLPTCLFSIFYKAFQAPH